MMLLLFLGDQTETQPGKLLYIKCYVQQQHVSCNTSQDFNYTAKKECSDVTANSSNTFKKLRHKYKIVHQLSQKIKPSVLSA